LMVRKPLPSGEHRIALQNLCVQSSCAYLVEIFTGIRNGTLEERFPQVPQGWSVRLSTGIGGTGRRARFKTETVEN